MHASSLFLCCHTALLSQVLTEDAAKSPQSPRAAAAAAIAARNAQFVTAMARAESELEPLEVACPRAAAVAQRNKRLMHAMGIGARLTKQSLQKLEHGSSPRLTDSSSNNLSALGTRKQSVPTYGEDSSVSTRTANSESLHPFLHSHRNLQRVSSHYVELRIPAVLDHVELSKPFKWTRDSPLLLAEQFQIRDGTFKRPIYNRRDFVVAFKNLLILYESDVALSLEDCKCVWTGPLVSSEGSMHVPMYHRLVHNISAGMAVVVLRDLNGSGCSSSHDFMCYTGTVQRWTQCADSTSRTESQFNSESHRFPSFRYKVCIQGLSVP